MEEYITTLNPEQQHAVTTVNGPLLILAGAGTGKTRTITTRIAYILKNELAYPDQILAVTFTNKAAGEMMTRVNELVNTHGIWLGTFHAIAVRILRQHAPSVGLRHDFTIINVDDQLQIIKNIVNEMYPEFASDAHKKIINIIQRWKDKGLKPQDVTSSELNKSILYTAALNIYHSYQDRLKFLNSVDFGDLLMHNIDIFTNNNDILSLYQQKFKYIMVDEYQDTNVVQYLWLRILSQKHKNICCVGDDDQSIYSWRGAEIGNILRFSDDFPNATVIRLECNYRSTSNILNVASSIIDYNKSRLSKKLWTTNGSGQKVTLMKFWDGKAEAKYISEYIISLLNDYKFKDVAILVRASFQTRVFEEYLIRYSIPYKIIGGPKFYDRQEIKDILAYLKLVVNPYDDISFERIINKPKRQIGAVTLKKIFLKAKETNTYMLDAAKILIEERVFSDKVSNAIKNLLGKIRNWQEYLNTKSLTEMVKSIAHESGYIEMLESEGETGQSRIENIRELFSALYNFEDTASFLEHIALSADIDTLNSDNAVCIMTLHAAKGLEFPVVFLPGWEEGVFPHEKSFHDNSNRALEEERRLAYVGITRAKQRLFISCAHLRDIHNRRQPMNISRFIKEIPAENIEIIKTASSYY